MKILVLSTWFPYPLIQGSKLRAYYLIRGLSQEHEVYLLSMQDAPVREADLAEMQRFCRHVEVVPAHPFDAPRWKKRLSLFSLQPSAAAAAYAPEMAAAVHRAAQKFQPDAVFALTFVTAPYALQTQIPLRIVDMDNLLALMLKETWQRAAGPQRWRAYLAYWKFARYARRLYSQFDYALVCSEEDFVRAHAYIPMPAGHIRAIANGVESSPVLPAPNQKQPDSLIFNGAVTYAPNLDAVQYFAAQILPLIRAQNEQVQLTITGRKTGVNPDHLPPASDHLRYSGFVEDIRALVAQSQICVVPLRQGAGTRLKILEAMAVGTPVVTTSKGAEGLSAIPGQHLLIGDTPQEFARHTLALLADEKLRERIRQSAHQFVREKYNWPAIQAQFNQLIQSAEKERV